MSRFHTPRTSLSRRAVLRGGGLACGLPLLEAMTGTLAFGRSRPCGEELPRRLVFLYVPNGKNMDAWNLREGVAGQPLLSPSLEPLAGMVDHISVLQGLTCDKACANGDGPGDHARASGAWLTCTQPLKGEGAVQVGVSADQLAARALGRSTPFRSLVLGGQRPRTSGQCDSGYSCAYSSHLSWDRPDRPVAKETEPVRLFDRLFRGGQDAASSLERSNRARRRGKLLDAIHEDARALKGVLGGEDRATLERYLEDLGELERRVRLMALERVDSVTDEQRPEGRPAAAHENLALLLDLVALALQTDRTRVVTVLLANEGSNDAFPELGITDGHHNLSHHGGDPAKRESIAKIDRAYVGLLAQFLARLDGAREDRATLLDQSAVLYGSGIADGNSHAHHDLPLVLAGRLGGRLKPTLLRAHEPGTPLANLHMTLLERMGVPCEAFGDATGTLASL